MADKKTKPVVPRRADAGANRFQLPERETRERDSSFVGELLKAAQVNTPTTHPPPTKNPLTTHPPPTTQPIAPERNFARVPNSIALSAIPSGIFRGESKKLYDALYQRTRGAVVPRRTIRATQNDLMLWANISHNTLKAHLRHLSAVGLIKVHYKRGESTGADYEIFTLEDRPPTNQPLTSHSPETSQNVGSPTPQNLVLGGGSQVSTESTVASDPNTSYNTSYKKIDDEAKAPRPLRDVERELTGKESNLNAWDPLFGLLTTELKIAAARTTVSNVPAFLTEHLRRRLFKRSADEMRVGSSEEAEIPATDKLNASACPDCGGTGWWYPEGADKGVAKCSHVKPQSVPSDT